MAPFTFADTYRAAGLSPGPDIIRLRQEPFDKLRKSIKPSNVVDLTRLYFGLPAPDAATWLRDAFAEADPSFTLVDNQREVSVLAVCLLSVALEDGHASAGLAPIVAAAAGNRTPVVRPEFVEEARQRLHERAVDARRRASADPRQITPFAKADSKVPAAAAALAQAGDFAKTAEIFKLVSEESSQARKTLADQFHQVLVPLIAEVTYLREELDMLWWYVGGWSLVLERPFTELEPALAAAMAGLDLASLTKGDVGPVAAPAILSRLISASRKTDSRKVAIRDAVDGFGGNAFERLDLDGERLKRVPDVCPVLTAFLKAHEIGKSPTWHQPFAKVSHMKATATFHPLELAMQVYREALLIALLA
jgi:hypothetical protein